MMTAADSKLTLAASGICYSIGAPQFRYSCPLARLQFSCFGKASSPLERIALHNAEEEDHDDADDEEVRDQTTADFNPTNCRQMFS